MGLSGTIGIHRNNVHCLVVDFLLFLYNKEKHMVRLLICLTLLGTMFVSGCTTAPTPEPLPAPENEWTIKMVHSGGIMGLSRSIEISSNGAYVVIDERAQQKEQGQLSDEELASLSEQVASLKYSPSSTPSGCADCFIYDLEISGTGKPFRAQVDDITLQGSGLGPLVMELRSILDRELN